MTGTKDNYYVGEIGGLTNSQKIVIEHLLKKKKYVLATWKLSIETNLSESTITKAIRILRHRGILIGSRGFPRINQNVLERLIERHEDIIDKVVKGGEKNGDKLSQK